MRQSDRLQLRASDIEQIAGVSRSKAVDLIRLLGGFKDVAGRWTVDTRAFYLWYNSPVRGIETAGGEYHMTIEKIVSTIREMAGENNTVSFSLIRKAGKSNWYLRIYGTGKTEKAISLGVSDKKTAREIESEVRARFHQLSLSGVVPYRTDHFFQEWLELKGREIAPGSHKRYRAVIDKAQPFMPQEMHLITSQHLERFKDMLTREGYKARSIILEINTLNTIFKKAVRLGYMRHNPAQDIIKPRKPQTEVEPYTDEEIDAIFTELNHRAETGRSGTCVEAWRTYEEIFYCLLYTGMRISDALSLQWENVSLRFSTIRLRQQKTGKEVHIRIPSPFRARLHELSDRRCGNPSGFVFCNSVGNPATYTRVDNAMRQVLSSCEIDKRSPIHSFRHTVAVRLLSAGVPIHEVAAQLGDTVETVVRNYVKPTAPAQSTIDVAYRHPFQGARKGPEDLEKTAHYEDVRVTAQGDVIPQKSPKIKGYLDFSSSPKTTVQM